MALSCQAPLDGTGKPSPAANKYLHMFNEDLKTLAEHDEDVGHQWALPPTESQVTRIETPISMTKA